MLESRIRAQRLAFVVVVCLSAPGLGCRTAAELQTVTTRSGRQTSTDSAAAPSSLRAARQTQDSPRPVTYQAASPRLAGFLFAVVRHTPGENDESVARLSLWSRRDLEPAVDELKRLARQFAQPGARVPALEPFGVTSTATLNALLKRAAMLLSDIAVLHKNSFGYSLPADDVPQTERPIVSTDGHVVGLSAVTFHWEAGRRLLDLVRPSPAADTDVKLWYDTAAVILQSWNDHYELKPHLAIARTLFPDAPSFMLYAGTLHETYAGPSIQNIAREQEEADRTRAVVTSCGRAPCAPSSSLRFKPWFGTPDVEWQAARTLFEAALKIDPNLSEARVRLANVLAEQQHHQAAVAQLRTVLTGSTEAPPLLRYFAWLLLGREERTLGHRAEAEAAFHEAAALYPEAQSPRVALSQLAREGGDLAHAIEYLTILEKPLTAAKDPWPSYDSVHVPDAAELRAALIERLLR